MAMRVSEGEEKLITREQVKRLNDFESGEGYLVTSLYLDVDGGKYPKPEEYETNLKNLIKEIREGFLKESELDRKVQKSIEDDLKKIENFINLSMKKRGGTKGLAIFSSSGENFWQIYRLPHSVRNGIRVDVTPYTRELMHLLDEYHRYCVVLANKENARIFLVYMGKIEEYSEVFDDVPGKAKEGGWGRWFGRAERRIDRHQEYHVHLHLKRVVEAVKELFKKERFNHLIIGGSLPEVASEFERTLPSNLQKLVVGHLHLDVDNSSIKQVLAESHKVEDETERAGEREVVARLKEELSPTGYGIAGLEMTLMALQEGQVQVLIIEGDLTLSGGICRKCNYLVSDANEQDCPICSEKVEPIPDLIGEMVDLTLSQGGEVEFVHDPDALAELRNMGEGIGIGALLRFR